MVDIKVENDRFDTKGKVWPDGPRRAPLVDIRDIESYLLQLQFEDLTGIESVVFICEDDSELSPAIPTTYEDDIVTIELSGDEINDCFERVDSTGIRPDGMQTFTAPLKIMSSEDAPIVTQSVDLIEHSVLFDQSLDGNPMFQMSRVNLDNDIEDAFRIVRSGLNFGAFDWSTSEGQVNSVFRVSGLPELDADGLIPGTTLAGYRGIVFVDNSSKGNNGFCEFDMTDFVTAGESLFTQARLQRILNEDPAFGASCSGGSSVNDFGRADLTFSWYLPTSLGDKVDMDRLLNTGGVFAGYGDNGNDAFSLKARSCDAGRFGPHVANNLSGPAADLLTDICGLGEATQN